MNLERVRIVLVRPEEAGNVGAVARVMKNFGMTRLVLVAPRLGRPHEAAKWAHGALDVLDGAEIVDDLTEAVASCGEAYATTRRRGRLRGPIAPIRAAAREARESQAEIAWVFGPESRGLSTREIGLCTKTVSIPTSPRHPSLNLAQAVAIACYEIASVDATPSRERGTAPLGEREAMFGHVESALLEIGYLLPHTARSRMLALRRILDRARLSSTDVRILRGLARQIAWAGSRTTSKKRKTRSGG
jgi:tRNA/rRNA methyltransferase